MKGLWDTDCMLQLPSIYVLMHYNVPPCLTRYISIDNAVILSYSLECNFISESK